eukprot:gb/GEZN01008614.1/.p1 GENE.gb/GEZN01008614.1/~~gb/GEZN01008614.1/.p1  ORF type:complete len:350 (-),score=35.26 gb/GEZN01008614.1/:270-1319(-)
MELKSAAGSWFTDEDVAKLKARQPTPAEAKKKIVDKEGMYMFVAWMDPRSSVSFEYRIKLLMWFVSFVTCTLVDLFLQKLRLVPKKEDLRCSELVPGRVWSIEYFHGPGISNSFIIRGKDASLLMFQAPPPSERVLKVLQELGELKVVMCPDVAHDAYARQWKLLMPRLKFVSERGYRDLWSKCGDDSFIDEAFDKDAPEEASEKPLHTQSALLSNYYFNSHYGCSGHLTWNDYAHVLLLKGEAEEDQRKIVILPCAMANSKPHPLVAPLWRLSGMYGMRVLFHSPFLYCVKSAFRLNGEFEQWWRRIYALKPTLVLFRHGQPTTGENMTQLRLGTDCRHLIFPRRVKL